jgi:hypothetical protein
MLVATARTSIIAATIFSLEVDTPWIFLPFQNQKAVGKIFIGSLKQLIKYIVKETKHIYLRTMAAGNMNAMETVMVDPMN